MRRLLEYAITLAVFSLAANAQSAYPVLEQKAEVVSKLPFIYSCPLDGSICIMERNKRGDKIHHPETVGAYNWATITTKDLLCPVSQSELTDTVLNDLHYQTVTNGTVLYCFRERNCDINITDANLTDFIKIVSFEDEPDTELCTLSILNQTSLIEKLISDLELYNISKYLQDTESCNSYVPEIRDALGSCKSCVSEIETRASNYTGLYILGAFVILLLLIALFFSHGLKNVRSCLWKKYNKRVCNSVATEPLIPQQVYDELRKGFRRELYDDLPEAIGNKLSDALRDKVKVSEALRNKLSDDELRKALCDELVTDALRDVLRV